MQVDAKVMLFDEPTASLAEHERDAVLELMKSLRARGITVVFVSHHLEEVLEVCDDITVFRDGALVASRPRAEWTQASLVGAMLGEDESGQTLKELEESPQPSTAVAASRSGPLLRAEGLTLAGAVEDVSVRDLAAARSSASAAWSAAAGPRCCAALPASSRARTGRLWIDGEEVPWPKTVRRALSYGITLVPEDRKGQGLGLGALGGGERDDERLRRRRPLRFPVAPPAEVDRRRGGDAVRLRRRAGSARPRGHLSGGNQQKLLLAARRQPPPQGAARRRADPRHRRRRQGGNPAQAAGDGRERGCRSSSSPPSWRRWPGSATASWSSTRGGSWRRLQREEGITPTAILSHVLQVEETQMSNDTQTGEAPAKLATEAGAVEDAALGRGFKLNRHDATGVRPALRDGRRRDRARDRRRDRLPGLLRLEQRRADAEPERRPGAGRDGDDLRDHRRRLRPLGRRGLRPRRGRLRQPRRRHGDWDSPSCW